MTAILANYPALTVINPAVIDEEVKNIQLNEDKGYCRVSNQEITIRSLSRDRYEYIRNFYFGSADGEFFCNPSVAMISSTPSAHKVTIGYELGDTVTIEGKNFILQEAPNHNIKLVEV